MGSYRRGADNSGDVDILITRDTEDGRTHQGVMRRLVKGLVEGGVITHEVCFGCASLAGKRYSVGERERERERERETETKESSAEADVYS
jgi:hypothetical protein